MGEVVQFRDFQSGPAADRARKALEEHLNNQMIEMANSTFPCVFGTDPSLGPNPFYHAAESDPA